MTSAAKLIQERKHLLPINGPVPNRRILVVDDEPEIGAGIQRILCPQLTNVVALPRTSRNTPSPDPQPPTSPEFEITVVTTPDQAIQAVAESLRDNKPFAMGFFDVVLNADIDGIELVKQILSVDPRMFAVFVTAYQDRTVDTIGSYIGEENREKWDYINKPFTEGEILQKARNATSLWDLHRLKEWQEERLSEAHQLLLHSERQNAAAAVGRCVAHEFGNLLTHIVGHAELALLKKDPEGMRVALDVILKAGDTASHILRRFRTMQDSSKNDPDMEIKDIWVSIDESLELLEFQLKKRYINVVRGKKIPMPIKANHHALTQVFVNIFINAIHAMPSGGEIHIRLNNQSDKLQISIRDTGPGIPEEILPRVTEPLFTTKGSEGSGLGLAICKELIEVDHAGEFRIANHVKGGVEVSIELPKEDAHEH